MNHRLTNYSPVNQMKGGLLSSVPKYYDTRNMGKTSKSLTISVKAHFLADNYEVSPHIDETDSFQ